ncbi:MAG: tetratricopeptide repeat protein [Dysgonomonas sp.]
MKQSLVPGFFLGKYQKQILIAVGVVIVVVCGFLAYKTFIVKPKNEEAQKAIIRGQQYFEQRQDSLAVYGDGNGYVGFETIINQYGSTKTGNIAKYYAGISYYRLGKYDQAISYLKGFSSNDKMVQYTAKGVLADCLVNTGKSDEALKYFLDAAKGADDNLLSPIYYKKAGVIYRDQKNYDKVIEIFTTIKDNYMSSAEAADADKYIEEAKLLKSK